MLSMLFISTCLTVAYSLRLVYYCILQGGYRASVHNYGDSYLILSRVQVLSVVVIIIGSSIRWLVLPEPIFFQLTLEMKLLRVVSVLLIITLRGFIFFFNKCFSCFSFYSYFFGLIWFLPKIRAIPLGVLTGIVSYSTNRDQAWLEEAGTQGVRGFLFSLVPSFIQANRIVFVLKMLLLVGWCFFWYFFLKYFSSCFVLCCLISHL